nr:hypothetical protein [Tanacetum cinerariifolium]
MRKHRYGYLEEIVVRRVDNALYKFKEGDDVADFAIVLRMFTRILVIQKRVEDLQLGVKSYQKQINASFFARRHYQEYRHGVLSKNMSSSFMYWDKETISSCIYLGTPKNNLTCPQKKTINQNIIVQTTATRRKLLKIEVQLLEAERKLIGLKITSLLEFHQTLIMGIWLCFNRVTSRSIISTINEPSPVKGALSARLKMRHLSRVWFCEEMWILLLELIFTFPCELRTSLGVPSNFDDETLMIEQWLKDNRALSIKLDWENPNGSDYPFDHSKPLPLIMRGNHQSVPVEFFINNEIKYLQGGIFTMTYTTSTTKTKAAQCDLPGIKDMVPNIWSLVKVAYDKYAL